MTKQEFLAMSLPYDLRIADFNDEGKLLKVHTLYGGNYYSFCKFNYYKPICRPLSDITKEIEHKGEKFVPIERLKTRSIPIKIDNLNCISLDDIYSSYTETTLNDWITFISYLLEWHFDIADLISKGEAIDVNTLEINPYK